MNSLNDIYKNQSMNLDELNLKNIELKSDLDKKEYQISKQSNEINQLTQQTKQMNQIISDLELKKIELMEKVHNTSTKDDTYINSDTEIIKIIKVYFFYFFLNEFLTAA